ncbi:hypothetical protein BFR04_06090 [Gaetbulibacter sp. 4G1]|nr:GNAT family protein [Gaetbulibacter sp. 4G1]PIA79090.1 hypothetical protein BFR04_06090 [Gaetbulibacter sp. 4G1]
MSHLDYKLERINSISFEAFLDLIYANKTYIEKGFAGTVKRCETQQGAKTLFDEWVSEESEERCFSFFIKNTQTDNLVGLVNIKNIDNSVKKCEIGYFISKQTAGKGIVSKFTSEVVTYCFEVLQMNKVFLRIAPDNIGSQKVAIKNGFQKEGVLREEYKGFQDKFEDVMYFGLLKNDYLKSKNV